MRLAAAKVPGQPAIDGTEGQFATLGAGARSGQIVEQPAEFGAGKIGVNFQTGFTANQLGVAGGNQFIAKGRGAPVLPDNRRG